MSGEPPTPGRSKIVARIERIFDHASDTRSLFLVRVDGASLRFVPGHFISLTIPLDDEIRTRPYSIASSPEDGANFEICFNRVPNGRGVAWLFDRRVGDTIEFVGPFGTFTMDRAPQVEIGFIAEGTGIAPIRPMLKRAFASASIPKMHLIYAAQDEQHILYRSELDEFAGIQPNFTYERLIASTESIANRVHELTQRHWVDGDTDRSRHFYICGVGKMVIQLRDLLRGSGYERRAVHYEQW